MRLVGRSKTDFSRGLWVRKDIKRRNTRELKRYEEVE
jgi:hypothetical protein